MRSLQTEAFYHILQLLTVYGDFIQVASDDAGDEERTLSSIHSPFTFIHLTPKHKGQVEKVPRSVLIYIGGDSDESW